MKESLMSLYTLPISVSDLTQLQLGIELFSNTAEATTEAGLITNPPNTVYSGSSGNRVGDLTR
jgi:hypothetical protein